jgi:hypothetical protein
VSRWRVQDTDHHRSTSTTTPAGPEANRPSATVVYHGVAVAVPQTFTIMAPTCQPITADVVILDTGQSLHCPNLPARTPKPTPAVVVSLRPASAGTDGIPLRRHTTLDGTTAWIGSRANEPHRITTVLVIPGNHPIVAVTAPTSAAARAILDTVHLTPVHSRS